LKISPSKLFWLGLFGLFFLIAAVLYSPSLGGPWQYDDYAQILDEKVLTGRSLPQLLSSTFRFTAHPDGWTGTRDLVRASFLVNWQWWGNDPAGYRWVNLLIHVVNATMVAILSYQLSVVGYQSIVNRFSVSQSKTGKPTTGKPESENRNLKTDNLWLPALAGLLFLVHPLNSQSVAYVAQRFTSMAAMFYLGTVVCWLVYLRSKSIIYYLSSIILALLALNSKEIAVTLPITLLLVSLALGKEEGKRQKAKGRHFLLPSSFFLLPFLLLSLKIPSQIISSSFGNTGKLSEFATVAVDSFALKQKAMDLTRHDYFLTQINVVGTYLRLAVLPVRQTLDYDYPLTTRLDVKTILKGGFHLGLILIAVILLMRRKFSIFNFPRKAGSRSAGQFSNKANNWSLDIGNWSLRLVGLGVLWFYLTLLPESSVVPIADLIYEHRTYLPMVGLVVALAGAAGAFFHKANESHEPHEPHVSHAVVATAIMLILAAATMRRAYVWGNEVRLWGDIYEKAPNKPRANKNYGVVLAAAGKYEEGVKRLARAVELEPENADYWSNFGTAYLRWGKYQDSAGKFLKAYELFIVQHPSISSNPSDPSNSPKDLKQAAQYMNDYGVSMVQLQRGDEALAGFEKALKIDPTLYAAWLGLGASYNIKGDSEMAIKTFFQVVKDFPDQPDGYNNLAIVLKKAGRIEEAAAVLSRMPKKSP